MTGESSNVRSSTKIKAFALIFTECDEGTSNSMIAEYDGKCLQVPGDNAKVVTVQARVSGITCGRTQTVNSQRPRCIYVTLRLSQKRSHDEQSHFHSENSSEHCSLNVKAFAPRTNGNVKIDSLVLLSKFREKFLDGSRDK